MINLLTPYKWAIIGALALAALFAGYKFVKYEQNKGYQKATAEYNAKLVIAQQAAIAKERQLNDKVQKAANEAIEREAKIKELSGSLDDTNKRMRDTVADLRRKLSRATEAAARKQADAALGVSGECADEYIKLAKEAARLSSELTQLQDAWPE